MRPDLTNTQVHRVFDWLVGHYASHDRHVQGLVYLKDARLVL